MTSERNLSFLSYFLIGFSTGFLVTLSADILDDSLHGIPFHEIRNFKELLIPVIFGLFFALLFMIYGSKEITKKRAQDDLVESEKRFRLFYQNSPLSYQSLDSDGIILEVNDAWLHEMEYDDRDEIIGRPFIDFVHDSQKTTFPERFGMFKKRGLVSGIEWSMITKTNKIKYVLLDGKFSYIGEEPERSFCVFRDITEEKIAEQKLQESQERLARIERLDIAYKMARRLAHDINNILTILSGNVMLSVTDLDDVLNSYKELIERINNSEITNDEITQYLINKANLLSEVKTYQDGINEGIEKGATYTRRLLKTANKSNLNKEIYSAMHLSELIDEILNFSITSNANIEIVRKYDDINKEIEFDPDVLSNAILNLVLNAKDAIRDEGKIEISVEDYISPIDDINFIKIGIKDNGVGIKEGDKGKIFQPFFTTKLEGSGIGLTSTYDQINEMGGRIDFSSTYMHGSIFNIYLPISNRKLLDKIERNQNIREFTGSILIVDDQEQIRGLLKRSLELRGYKVITAENGKVALDKLNIKSNSISGILSDVRMPIMNGIELYQNVVQSHPELKFILMTGYFDEFSENEHYASILKIKKPILDADLNRICEEFST